MTPVLRNTSRAVPYPHPQQRARPPPSTLPPPRAGTGYSRRRASWQLSPGVFAFRQKYPVPRVPG
eukprot:1955766-Rhodomonas_salina.1